ncbi:MAG: MerR family transcriptional regulator [Bacteroidales bacterium]|nr:MerR family transcriptional regulator [Bacteroidales bacterium]
MSEEQKKDLKRFFSIKEVAEEFGVNETLLRFWEKEFPQISPKKGGRGIRFYTHDDIEQIRIIYNLVKVRGLKIAAARDLLRKNKEGTTQAVEAVEHLRNARAALVELRNQLSEM